MLFSHSVVSSSLWPHELQNRLPCPSLSPGDCSNSCALSHWCHSTISSSVFPFSCPQSFPASGAFTMSLLFLSGGQSIGASASASASVLPMNSQSWFPLGSPCCPRDLQESSPAPQFESINSSALSLLYGPILTSIHDYWKNQHLILQRSRAYPWHNHFLFHKLLSFG